MHAIDAAKIIRKLGLHLQPKKVTSEDILQKIEELQQEAQEAKSLKEDLQFAHHEIMDRDARDAFEKGR